jgi:predicted dienelactone hydrolase
MICTKKQSSVTALGALLIALAPGEPTSATSSAEPLFDTVNTYQTTITTNGDPADIYFPIPSNSNTNTNQFPIALMLQGALVDKADYANFASTVASYGFVVVVPNHERTVTNPNTGEPVTGFLAEQQQVNDILTYMKTENANPASPIAGIVNTNKLGLLGHSFGGFVGLAVIQDICVPRVCAGNFTQSPEVMAGIFYGTNFKDPPETGSFPPINNQRIPTALIAGSQDTIADLLEVTATYNQIQDPPKALVIVKGANHYGITDEDNPVRDPVRPLLDQDVATETIARWSALFLRSHLLNDTTAFDYLYNSGDDQDENVIVIHPINPLSESALPSN